jgi:hypothetical protein
MHIIITPPSELVRPPSSAAGNFLALNSWQ